MAGTGRSGRIREIKVNEGRNNMEYSKLGNTDIEVSKICVGCMSFGKAGTLHDWTVDENETENIVKHALDLGINFFDTANGYSDGTSEEYLGRAIKKNISREDLCIPHPDGCTEHKSRMFLWSNSSTCGTCDFHFFHNRCIFQLFFLLCRTKCDCNGLRLILSVIRTLKDNIYFFPCRIILKRILKLFHIRHGPSVQFCNDVLLFDSCFVSRSVFDNGCYDDSTRNSIKLRNVCGHTSEYAADFFLPG